MKKCSCCGKIDVTVRDFGAADDGSTFVCSECAKAFEMSMVLKGLLCLGIAILVVMAFFPNPIIRLFAWLKI